MRTGWRSLLQRVDLDESYTGTTTGAAYDGCVSAARQSGDDCRFLHPATGQYQPAKVAQASSLHESSEQAGSLRYPVAMEPARLGPGAGAISLTQTARRRAGSMAATLAILFLGAAALFWWRNPARHPGALPANILTAPVTVSEKSIAVLPFAKSQRPSGQCLFRRGGEGRNPFALIKDRRTQGDLPHLDAEIQKRAGQHS